MCQTLNTAHFDELELKFTTKRMFKLYLMPQITCCRCSSDVKRMLLLSKTPVFASQNACFCLLKVPLLQRKSAHLGE